MEKLHTATTTCSYVKYKCGSWELKLLKINALCEDEMKKVGEGAGFTEA